MLWPNGGYVAVDADHTNVSTDAGPVVVVLTALPVEYRAVRDLLVDPSERTHDAGSMFEIGELPEGRGPVAVGRTGVGNLGAAIMLERAAAMFRPVAILFAGIAGVLRDGVTVGDVVVATTVYAYHGGRATDEGS